MDLNDELNALAALVLGKQLLEPTEYTYTYARKTIIFRSENRRMKLWKYIICCQKIAP
jgi:hypothetical protein